PAHPAGRSHAAVRSLRLPSLPPPPPAPVATRVEFRLRLLRARYVGAVLWPRAVNPATVHIPVPPTPAPFHPAHPQPGPLWTACRYQCPAKAISYRANCNQRGTEIPSLVQRFWSAAASSVLFRRSESGVGLRLPPHSKM